MVNVVKLPGISEDCEEYVSVIYSGNSPVLRAHQIGIKEYAFSIVGYEFFTRHIAKEILRSEINISIASENEGSFETLFHLFLETIGVVSSVLGILSFFGVSAKNMGEALLRIQSGMMKKYVKHYGNVNELIEDIKMSEDLTDEDKVKLINAISNEQFMESMDSFTSPLDSEGYNKIGVKKGKEVLFEVHESERDYFRFVPPAGEIESEFNDIVEILYLSPDLIKWKFKGRESFWADVLDRKFIEATGNMKSTDLKGVKYYARGRTIARRKEGGKKWITTWYIDKIEQQYEQMPIL